MEKKKNLLTGVIANKGMVKGKARIIKDYFEVELIQPGEIMVVKNSHPLFAIGVLRAGGLICEEGSVTSHICTIATEIGIPCLTQAEKATEIILDEDDIILDADEGFVYKN